MPFPPRFNFFLFAVLVALVPACALHAQIRTAPAAIPATLNVVTFAIHFEGEERKLIVTPSPFLLRVDTPDDGLTIIYDPRSQYYIGLENRNYTYWEFSWPEVKSTVESSQRFESRLREFGADSLNDAPPADDSSAPTPAGSASAENSSIPSPSGTNTAPGDAPPLSDDTGYAWQQTTTKKRIAGLDCVLWNGTSVSSDPVQAWCYNGLQPAVQDALTQLRAINEPMALVPVRDLTPPFVFEVVSSLAKGGVTPLLITWGDDSQSKNRFELASLKTREGKPSLFAIPNLYVKTTLVTMDGMGNQKPQEGVAPLPLPSDRPHAPIR